jgi:hypothetical protein
MVQRIDRLLLMVPSFDVRAFVRARRTWDQTGHFWTRNRGRDWKRFDTIDCAKAAAANGLVKALGEVGVKRARVEIEEYTESRHSEDERKTDASNG